MRFKAAATVKEQVLGLITMKMELCGKDYQEPTKTVRRLVIE